MEPLFTLENVSFDYEGIPALRDLSIAIHAGERVAVIGANGSGKSTLLRLLDGLCFPTSGSLRFGSDELGQEQLANADFNARFRRAVGFVFQNPDVQLFNPSVFDEIAFGPMQLKMPKEVLIQTVNDTISRFALEPLKDRPPYRLSGGEKKKVALASILVMDPKALLLDEPTSSLDPRSQSRLIEMIREWKTDSKTVVTATHELALLEELADRVLVMMAGTIVASGTPAEILANTELLLKANLVHEHRHKHGPMTHSHPHLHKHSHEKE